MSIDKAYENRLRRWAKRLGYDLRKSGVRNVHYNNYGGYQLREQGTGDIVAGPLYELNETQIIALLHEREAELRRSRFGVRG